MDYEIDDLDRRVLYHLARDARGTSAPDVAEEMDVSPGTVRNRIRNLEEAGVIRGYHAHVDYERCGGRLTNLLVCSTSVAEQERMARRILSVPGVVNVREVMTGHGNLRVKAVGTDTNDLARIARKLTNLGLEIEDEDLLRNEYHHPYHAFGPDDGSAAPPDDADLGATREDEVLTARVAEDAPVAHRTLKEANEAGLVGEDVLVVAVVRDDAVLTPRGDTTIRPGDRVKVFSPGGVPPATLRAFRPAEA